MGRALLSKYRRLLRKMNRVDNYNTNIKNLMGDVNELMTDVLTINEIPFNYDVINNLKNDLNTNHNMITRSSIIPDIKDDIEDLEDDDD